MVLDMGICVRQGTCLTAIAGESNCMLSVMGAQIVQWF